MGLPKKSVEEFVLTIIILFDLFLLFYWKLLFNIHGFLVFGNFSQTLNLAEINQFFPFYNPFSNFGSIVSFPLGTTEYYAIGIFTTFFPSMILGLFLGIKAYIFITSIIFGLSFFYFTSIFTHNYLSRLVSTLFFLFNPFTIQLYASGDFSEFIFQSFVLIGAAFLYKAIIKKDFINPYYLVSAFFMVLSFVMLEAFLANVIMYFIVLIYTTLFVLKREGFRAKILNLLKSIFAFSLPAIFLGLIVILPILFGPISYLPSSVSSLPLGAFIGGALGLFKVITLDAYPPFLSWISVFNSFGPVFYSVWYWLEIMLITLLLLSYLFLRDKRLLFFSLIIIALSLFASETKGPISSLTVYLYEHLPGYQALNYPYLWVWFLIMPVYAIVLSVIFTDLSSVYSNSSRSIHKSLQQVNTKTNTGKRIFLSQNIRKILKYSFFGIIIFVLVSPIVTQGYYGVNGIRKVNMPSWFNDLNGDLVSLTGENHSGVIFNTINPYFQFGDNSSNGLGNLLQYIPSYGTVGLSSYIPNYNTVTNFYYWFYYTLYNNQTKYSAQILASVGVQYFVDIYNANSEGYLYFVPWSYNVNASGILLHQPGWDRIVHTQNFSIFKNEYYNRNAYYTNGLSLILGNYNTLNEMAYLGIALANVTPVFPTDLIDSQNSSEILNHTDVVVISGYNSIYDLMLSLTHSPLIYPVNYVDGEQSDGSLAWTNSERSDNYPFYATLSPYAETTGNNNLNIPLKVKEGGVYSIYAKIAFDNSSVKGGTLNILANAKLAISLNTSRGYENETNGFLWVKFNAALIKGENTLTLQSRSGFNAVSEISVLNQTELKEATASTESFLSKERNNIIQVFQPQQIIPSNNTGYYYGSGLGYKFPNGNYLYLSGLHGTNSFSISSLIPFNGTLLVSALSDAYYILNVTYRNTSTTIGVSPGVYISSSNASSGSILLPVMELKRASVSITTGVSFIGLIALLPSNYRFLEPSIKRINVGNITYRGIYGGITKFNISEAKYYNYTTISGSFTYRNVSDYFPVTIGFSGDYPYNRSVIFLSNVSGPATLDINGMTIESTDFYGCPLISPSLNDQYQGRPSNIELSFVPERFHSNVSYKVSFYVRVLGYSNYPHRLVRYSPAIMPGANISYTISGYEINAVSRGVLILRVPFSSGFESNVKLSSAENGLMTLIVYEGQATVSVNHVIHVSADVYRLFMISVYTAVSFSATYLGLYLFFRIKRKRIKLNS
jgi:hypothetical protein